MTIAATRPLIGITSRPREDPENPNWTMTDDHYAASVADAGGIPVACSNARKITALIDGRESVVVVIQALRVCLSASGVAKLGDVGLQHVRVLADAQLLARLLGSVDEVEVICGVLVMQRNEARRD